MKNFLKHLISRFLGFLATAVLRRYHPKVVMVTGSVGKTSTKDAVAAALTAHFLVRKSDKSFNSEFGVPFTVLGVENPWKNPFAWMSIGKRAFALLFLPNQYPNMLVLEVGADKPGDLSRILRMVTPDAVVVTRLPEIPVHVEAYASPEAVREEEFSPAYALPAGAPLIVPADDEELLDRALRTQAKIFSYGVAESAQVRISDEGFDQREGRVTGMRASIGTIGAQRSLVVKGAVGVTQLFPPAAALAAAFAFDISLEDALHALEEYVPPSGRAHLLRGKQGAVIIDDSYNSSPVAVDEALKTLKAFPNAKRRIAVLADMLELGRYSVMEHERIGALAVASADVVVTVGVRARAFVNNPGTTEVLQYTSAKEAALALPEFLKEGDVVLVKGSQSMRMERVVEALLADPADVIHLVRQERAWKRKG